MDDSYLRLLFVPFAAYDEAEGLKLLEAVSVDNVKAVEMILQQPRDPNFCDLDFVKGRRCPGNLCTWMIFIYILDLPPRIPVTTRIIYIYIYTYCTF